MPSPTTAAYHVPPTQLQNFGDVSLSKESKSVGGQFYPDWVIKKNLTSFWDECNVVLHELIKEGRPINSTTIQARLCQKEKELGVDRIVKKGGDSDNKVNSAIEKTESNITYAESILEKQDDKVLGSYSKEEQPIVQVTQPSCSPNVFEKVCLASDLPIFRFGRNFIVDASIRKILISNLERPMKKGNLFGGNKIVAKHIGQHIVPVIKTDCDLLLQPKFSPLLYQKFIYNWVALLVSYLAYTWYQLRHVYSNYLRFRNLKPRLNSIEKTDANNIL